MRGVSGFATTWFLYSFRAVTRALEGSRAGVNMAKEPGVSTGRLRGVLG